jgi:hypothetical protein
MLVRVRRRSRSRWASPDDDFEGLSVVRRLLILVMLAGSVLAACQSAAAPTPANPPPAAKPVASPAASPQAAAAASPAASPVPSPSPAPAAGAATPRPTGTWATIQSVLTGDLTLLIIGIVLSILAVIAWSLSNRAEATPNEDQVAEMHHFVNDHFAKYVARGLASEGVGPVAVSKDPAWRNVYLQHLRLHNELHSFVPPRRSWWAPIVAFACAGPVGVAALWVIRRGVTPTIALRIFEADIDEAVRRELDVLRATGQGANPAVSA